MEDSRHPRSVDEHVSEETSLPLTMLGFHDTEAGNSMLIKTTTGEVKENIINLLEGIQ